MFLFDYKTKIKLMKKILAYILILTLIVLASCKKILDRVDFGGLSDNQVWNDSAVANTYLSTLYSLVIPVWPSDEGSTTLPTPIHNISDDANGTSNSSTAILYGTLTVDQITDFYTGTSGVYYKIRQINTLLSGIDSGTLGTDTKNRIKAQAYFLRAYCYYDLIKFYGGVPYIKVAQNVLTDSLNVARDATSTCISNMIEDLAHCSVLPSQWTATADYGRITRGAALALKGRILLLWASPQFNTANDATRWENAYQANKNAYDTLILDGYALYSNFSRIFLDAYNSAIDKEPILFRSYNGSTTSGLYNSYDNVTRPFTQSSGSGGKTNNPTWNLVQAFPMQDGKAITDITSSYKYYDSLFWKNRDPRFYSTIVYNGAVYGLSSTSGRKEWTYTGILKEDGQSVSSATTTGFYCRKNIDTSITVASQNVPYGKTAWIEMRLAEVMLNLAECANATSRQTEAYTMMVAIRKRAGLDAGTSSLYGLSSSMTTAQMETAILLERRIEFAFEGKRYDDLRRTRTFDALNGTYRNQLVVTPRSPYTVATLEANVPGTTTLVRDTINIEKEFNKYFSVAVKPITSDQAINFLTNYYIYGIPTTNISKDPNLIQTLGWGSGTFDGTK